MQYRRLYIRVEGVDDKRFIESIIKPILEKKYNSVDVLEYASKRRKKIRDFLEYIKKQRHDYIFLTDINDTPCVPKRKEVVQDKFNIIDKDKVMVVIKEIESWYLAGLDDITSLQLRVRPFNTTDNITKEQFNELIPKKFAPRTNFMREILECFSIETATKKNTSFRYFVEKYLY